MPRFPRLLLALSAGTLLLALTSAASRVPEPTLPAADGGRVVVLGFDGADARTVRELMAAHPGRFPTFEKLSSEGTFAPLEVVAPPESPVSWAALNTGQNPAKTGVPGFIRRSLERDGKATDPTPDFGHIIQETIPASEVDGIPMASWSMGKLAGLGFVVGLVLGLLLFRARVVLAAIPALLGGGGGAYYAQHLQTLLPSEFPVTSNPNKAENFWDVTARAGVPTTVLDAAQAFSMPTPAGAKVLSGLGVPDARGGLGDWFVYTTDPEETEYNGRSTTTAGTVFRVDERGGEIFAKVYGPKNFWEIERLSKELDELTAKLREPGLSMQDSLDLSSREQELKPLVKNLKSNSKIEGRVTQDLEVRIEGDTARVTIAGQSQDLEVGDWSDWYELDFELNSLLHVKAITRARLVSLEPHFELYLNVLDLDPREPPAWQPLSSPPEFAAELAADCGLYETYGWPTMTMPFKDKEIDPELLMEDVEFTLKWREELTHNVLGKDDWQVFMSVFSTTDRVQHMMYQFYDEEHPLYDAEKAARTMTFFDKEMELRDAIPAIYEQMDRVIGDVLAKLNPEDTLFVCSDHGFQSFRRQVNINNWLVENGYLALDSARVSRGMDSFLLFVDWDDTKVYSLGMGFLYVNMEGRERKGIVPPDEAEALLAEVREKLLAATDPETGANICSEVYVTKDVHSGPYLDLEADMIIGFAPPYRVSWSTTSGGVHLKDKQLGPVFTDNTSNWSGGHISMHLPDVAGVFFSNKKVAIPAEGVRALQLAPTVLSLVGVPQPAEMDLGPLTLE